MGISVIIPSLNEEANIARAIASVQSFADEVIVADGGSTDTTREAAESLGCQVISVERGRGRQLRLGAEVATGGVLLFLHADSWLDEQAGQQLQHLQTQTPDSGATIFGCFRQRIDDRRLRFRALEAGNAFRARWLAMPYGDQAIFVDRQSYDRVGGFEEVPLMEDVILSQRLRKIQRPVVLDGPVHLNARRWQSDGVLSRTLRNWFIFTAFRCGVTPERLVKWYG